MSRKSLDEAQTVSVRIASTIEDIIACQRIRSACFLSGDEPAEYSSEFDGNDFSASTHLLALQNGSPVGTMRIRILNGKSASEGAEGAWERLAVLPGKRGSLVVLNCLAQAALTYSLMKGIDSIRGLVSDPRIAKFWKRTFDAVLTSDPPVMLDKHEYRHIRIDLRPFRVAINAIQLLEIEPDAFAHRVTSAQTGQEAA